MKFFLLLSLLCTNVLYTEAQNTFPTSGNVGIGITNPIYSLDINADIPIIRLVSTNASQPYSAIRGNNSTWIMGTYGQPGQEDISIGTQDGTGQRTLTFAAGGTARIKVLNNGNVGIGTTNPPTNGKLQVNGPIDNISVDGNGAFRVYDSTHFSGGVGTDMWASNGNTGNSSEFAMYSPAALQFYSAGVKRMSIINSGNVGIGTTNPDQKLSVAGTIHSQAVKVDMTGWSDYVFEPSYNLSSLEKVKAYIDQNHHLPDMPSEKEIIKNGVDLGEMVKLQQKKIEELTLYLIELKKENIVLTKRIDNLENSK